MPLVGLISLGVMFAGVMYLHDAREDFRRFARIGIIAGAVGITLVAMTALGPIVALTLFALFVAVSFWTRFWS